MECHTNVSSFGKNGHDESTNKVQFIYAECNGEALKYFYSKLEQIFSGVTVTIKPQTFTDEQKAQARANIGAGSADFTGDYEELINKPNVAGQSSINAGKTIKSWSETDGKVSITTQDIEIVKEQISDFAHTHSVEDITDLDGMNFATEQYVADAIEALPSPMVFKGSLGTDGTITTLPNAVKANTGHTYKVITDNTYSGQKAKTGDMFISDGSKWVYIPSADEEGGVTSVNVSVPTGLSVSGVPITTSGTIAITNEVGYSIPTDAKQGQWDKAFTHSESDHARVDATKVEVSETNGNIKIDGVETTVYEHPTQTAKTSGVYKIEVDNTGHVSNAVTATASDLDFDNADTQITSNNVQGAIEESFIPTYTKAEFDTVKESIKIGQKFIIVDDEGEGGSGASSADKVSYDNTSSGLTATDVQTAIDELNIECIKTPVNEIATIGQSLYVKSVDSEGKPTFGYKSALDPDIFTSYDKIASIVRAGLAENYFKIGDQITTTYTDTNGTQYEMPWDVVAFRTVELENGSKVPGMIIQSHYATVENMQFDAPEPSSSDSNVKNYGWNRWLYSGIRQWLNSDKAKGLWWTSTHTEDVAPSQLSSVNGFMKGLPTDFINMLKPTKHETALNYVYPSGSASTYVYDTTYDIFFLPSLKEEHFKYSSQPDESDREGSTWEYWVSRKGETAQGYGSAYKNINAIRYSLANKTTAKAVWLRSANRSASYTEFYVNTTGYYSYDVSYNRNACAPACVIC